MLSGVTVTGQRGCLDIISSLVIPEPTSSEVWERVPACACAKLGKGDEKKGLGTYHLILVPFVE